MRHVLLPSLPPSFPPSLLTPSGPDGVDLPAFGDLDDEHDVGVVIVVGA